mmetsp:Transcript_11375/g.34186  ORF Transcript_11375/g.34186 Transcript_11375/m.34186 type:complete len:230 (-) Transcript_11375:405-1094(-)
MSFNWDDCEVSQGWQRRIAAKMAAAGITGATMGSIIGMLRQAPPVQYAVGTAASCAFCMSFFSVVQETARRGRCRGDPWNSALAGATAGTVLVGIHQGSRSKGVSAGLYCALAAAAVHAVDDRFHMTMWLRPVPEAERIAAEAAAAAAAAERRASDEAHVPSWWERILPIRKMSDQEWDDYQEKKTTAFRERVQAAKAGGLPKLVEQHREQQGSPQEPQTKSLLHDTGR